MVLLFYSAIPFMQSRFDESADSSAAAYRMAPDSAMFTYWYAMTQAYAGRTTKCLEIVEALPDDPGDDAMKRLAKIIGRAVSGDRAGADALITSS